MRSSETTEQTGRRIIKLFKNKKEATERIENLKFSRLPHQKVQKLFWKEVMEKKNKFVVLRF